MEGCFLLREGTGHVFSKAMTPQNYEWDVVGHVILEEMGVSVTDMFGQPLRYNQEVPKTHKGILVVHPDIKEVTLEKLAQCYESVKM